MKPNFVFKEEHYATHLPMLIRCVEMSDRELPILELGVGYSTFILDMLCKQNGQEIFSYENDLKWHGKFLEFHHMNHKIIYAEDWDAIPFERKHWGVVLIDHRPARRRRVEALRLKDCADYIILHDSEPEIDRFYGYKSIYKHFKYVHHYTNCMPNTTVLSNRKDLSNL